MDGSFTLMNAFIWGIYLECLKQTNAVRDPSIAWGYNNNDLLSLKLDFYSKLSQLVWWYIIKDWLLKCL